MTKILATFLGNWKQLKRHVSINLYTVIAKKVVANTKKVIHVGAISLYVIK